MSSSSSAIAAPLHHLQAPLHHLQAPLYALTSHLPPATAAINTTASDELHHDSSTPPLLLLVSSIISSSVQGRLSDAFRSFSFLRLRCADPPLLLRTLPSLLSCSTSQRALPQGRQLHGLVLSLGFHDHHSLVPRLTTFYAGFGLLSDAHAVVSSPSGNLDALQWNLLISAYVRDGLPSEALRAYKQMVHRGVQPDNFTYPSVLKCCGELLDLESGKEVHDSVSGSVFYRNLFIQNALVAMYAKCGALEVARKLFDEMPERDVVSWNSIISGYASRGMWEDAFGLFERMRAKGAKVNTVTWNTIVGGHLQKGNHREALRLISEVTASGSDVDFVTLIVGLSACSHIGLLKPGKEIHAFALRNCCDGLDVVRNALITMYSRCKDIEHACVLFRLTENPTLVTWNTMIAGFALTDQAEEASAVFRDMVFSGIEPNYVTVVTYLALCARVANLQHGRELHCYITKHGGFDGYRLLWNALIEMYSKSARIFLAQKVFDAMIDQDEVSYTSLIAGYGMQGEGITALRMFDQMIDRGIKPDHVSMVAVLTACSHCGLVSQGEMLFEKMVASYGIMPQMEHYSCMVDLFARAGLVRKAADLLDTTPFRPTAAMWAALVGACLVYGDTEIGERAAKKLLDMRTNNAGHYILIANMYASAGCWEELAKVRTLMRDMGVRKAPALAWADLGNGFHPFLVGDRSNSLAPEIYEVLDGLYGQMNHSRLHDRMDLGVDNDEVYHCA